MGKKKINMKSLFIWLIIVIAFTLFVISCIRIFTYFSNNNENKQIQKKIIENNIQKDEINNKYSVDFAALKRKNSDTVAYLKVNNTNIDYAVVKGKDNDFYLNYNFNKKKNIAGWIFSDYKNKFDGTDKNIVIFGHNMKNGSMFGTLKNTLKKDWQNNLENRNIILVTENGTDIYEVFSTYVIKPEAYYINTTFANDIEFNKFLETIKGRSNYNYNVNVTVNDHILTLSSCYDTGDERIVLHAKKK